MNKRILYFECYSGISGDMTVASLLDLGADWDVLRKVLNNLHPEEFTVELERVQKNRISALDFDVKLNQNPGHTHGHRNLNDIFQLLDQAGLSQKVCELSKKIFMIVAQAEAEAHALPLDQVHFHEVGATDSIVDIVSTAVCLDNLNVEKAFFSTLSEGYGSVECQHGTLPVPVPAVTNILRRYGLPIRITQTEGEMITPTGAAITAAINCGSSLPAGYRILKTGYGAGKRNYPNNTNVLRTYLLEEISQDSPAPEDSATVLMECNVDDMTGEELGFAMKRILEAGALDAWFTPIFTEKNRPAWIVSVVSPKVREDDMKRVLFRETSAIEIRFQPLARTKMRREFKKFESSIGPCNIKVCTYGDLIKMTPEYNDAVKIADKLSLSLNTVYQTINRELHDTCDKEESQNDKS